MFKSKKSKQSDSQYTLSLSAARERVLVVTNAVARNKYTDKDLDRGMAACNTLITHGRESERQHYTDTYQRLQSLKQD